jgi:hypothetical protein
MLKLHAKFSSEESQRYVAESRRLGRLANEPRGSARQRVPAKRPTPSDGWFGQLFATQRLPGKLAHR